MTTTTHKLKVKENFNILNQFYESQKSFKTN